MAKISGGLKQYAEAHKPKRACGTCTSLGPDLDSEVREARAETPPVSLPVIVGYLRDDHKITVSQSTLLYHIKNCAPLTGGKA